jgi:ATP-dependent protease ClpP protease subunit
MGLSWYQLRNYAALLLLSMTALLLSAAVNADASVTVETQAYDFANDMPAQPSAPAALARFGPFIVVAANRAELNGTIETNTPAQFRAMLRAYPALNQIDMIDCPGTGDDEANLVIARLIRKAGITTNIPDGGSVRSGGVELFLAGARRHAAQTAEFAVHSWRDEDGLEAEDYAANDAANLEYVNFYREIGMDADKAKAFYALTNSVPNDEALYLEARDIAAYIPLD